MGLARPLRRRRALLLLTIASLRPFGAAPDACLRTPAGGRLAPSARVVPKRPTTQACWPAEPRVKRPYRATYSAPRIKPGTADTALPALRRESTDRPGFARMPFEGRTGGARRLAHRPRPRGPPALPNRAFLPRGLGTGAGSGACRRPDRATPLRLGTFGWLWLRCLLPLSPLRVSAFSRRSAPERQASHGWRCAFSAGPAVDPAHRPTAWTTRRACSSP
jgi:hypothetical protein